MLSEVYKEGALSQQFASTYDTFSFRPINPFTSIFSLQSSRIVICHTLEVSRPLESRPNEGVFTVQVGDFLWSPSQSASLFDKIVDRCYRQSKFMDLESLCIFPSKAAWHLRVLCRFLSRSNNDVEALSLGLLLHLLTVRIPQATFSEDHLIVLSEQEKMASSLKFFSQPICLSSAHNNDISTILGVSLHDLLCCLSIEPFSDSNVGLNEKYIRLKSIFDQCKHTLQNK
jgi:hypothetical protein